jgi:hypothetical protein
MNVFHGLQDYFLDLYTRKDIHHGIFVNIHMFTFLHLDNKLIIQSQHKYIILRDDINLKYFRNLQTYSAKDISLQTIIDQGLVHAVYESMEKILYSDLGIAIKEACKKTISCQRKNQDHVLLVTSKVHSTTEACNA